MNINNIQSYISVSNSAINPAYTKSYSKDSFLKSTHSTSPLGRYERPLNPANLYTSQQLLRAFSNEKFIKNAMKKNPNIENLLKNAGINEPKVYAENILSVSNKHLSETTTYAMQIADNLNLSPLDKKILEQACVFHDFGKIMIPKEILLKPGRLTPEEKNIMDLHSDLGYEILKTTGINPKVLELVKNHHIPDKENSDMLKDILSVADIYSALREERSYKTKLSVSEALSILDQKATEGEVSPEVLDALKNSLNESKYAA